MSPSTATRRPGARGEIVQRGAHRHRVGVVAVVDQHDSVCAAPHVRRAAPRTRTSSLPRGVTPSVRAAAIAASRLRRLWACANDGRTACAPLPARDPRSSPRHRRRSAGRALHQLHIAALAERDRAQVGAQMAAPAAAPAAGTTTVAPGAIPAISSALAAATASSDPSCSRCTGPDVHDHPHVGLARSPSAPRSAPPRASPSPAPAPCVPAGAASTVSGSPISVLRFSRLATVPPTPRVASSAARMSFVEVFPVEPVIATTLALPPRAPCATRGPAPAAPRSGSGCASTAPPACAQRPLRVLGGNEHPPRARAQRLLRIGPPVGVLSAQAHEQVAGLSLARVDDHRRGPAALPPPHRPTHAPPPPRDPLRAPPCHAVAPAAGARRTRSASRATATSSNGTSRALGELLALLVALARDQHHIPGTCGRDRAADRLAPVGLHHRSRGAHRPSRRRCPP